MPYIARERRTEVDKDYMNCREPGDLAYAFARFFYKKWAKEPRWTTYHHLEAIYLQPSLDEEYEKMKSRLSMSMHFSAIDVQIGARAALNELYRKCVSKYENGKCQSNGEVYCD